MSGLIVRDYTRSDYPEVMRIWRETSMGGAERGDDQTVIERSIAMGGRMLLLIDSGNENIIGTSWMTFDGRRIHLHHFCIAPDHQGKGASRILLNESLRLVKEMGYQVKLEVNQENIKAVNLYKSQGFSRLGDYDIYIIRDVEMIRLLPDHKDQS
jgi:ribosomal protein S18 acetylase RimI-like enzyme